MLRRQPRATRTDPRLPYTTCGRSHRSALGWKSAVTPSAQPEFSRLERLDTMGRMSKPARIEAEADEREGLRRRFRLEALNSLAAEYTLAKDEGKDRKSTRLNSSH